MPVQQTRNVGNVPPFATNLPDSAYKSRQPIIKRAPVQRQARPTSAYDHYDGVFDNNDDAAGIGAGFMNGDADSDDSSDEESGVQSRDKHSALAAATRPQQHETPLAAPRPGYASRPPVLETKQSPSPPEQQRPPPQQQQQQQQQHQRQESRQRTQYSVQRQHSASQSPSKTAPPGVASGNRRPNPPGLQIPPAARAPMSSRSSPYFDEKMEPNALLTPTFDPKRPNTVSIAPSVSNSASGNGTFTPAFVNIRDSVRFNEEALSIMRGKGEGMVIPRRGARGDHFWRRFSTIAKEEKTGAGRSSWLSRNQSGKKTLSRAVWFATAILIICIAGGVGAGWYFGHNTPPSQPRALGGSADINSLNVTASSSTLRRASSSSLHVSPTNTVAKREASPIPIPAGHAQRRRTIQL